MEQKKVVKKIVKKPVANNSENFLSKLKRNWKNIALILLLLFSLSKCTNSCTRGREIDRLNYQIVQQDSALKANDIIIDKLSTRLDDANTSIDNYKGIATGNQKDLIDKLNTLTNDNKELNTKINKITKENNNLTKENTQLKKEIKTLEEKVSNLESYLSIE